MNAETSPLLEQLRDIQAAPPPGWWPPAPGWWLLAFLLLAVLVYLLLRFNRWYAGRRRRQAWLRVLDQLNREHDPKRDPHEYLAGLNRLFRAVALKAFPDTGCAGLQGEQWVAFIVSLMPGHVNCSSLDALATGPYEPLPRFESASLNSCAREWVNRYG